MRVRVVTPPQPIVTPAAIAGDHAADDAAVAALIAAATEEIDGPTGWLGRCLGPQTLELVSDCWRDRSFRLSCPPLIKVESVTYLDTSGTEQTVDIASYALRGDLLWFRPSWIAPSVLADPEPIRIRYKAGYNGATGAAEGEVQTGPVPERARQAIILAVQHLKALQAENLYLKSDEVEGIGRRDYVLSDQATKVVRDACDRLLSGLRIFSL